MSLHRYGFVADNPINFIDHYGYSWYGDAWDTTTNAVSDAGSFVANKTVQAYTATAGAVSDAGSYVAEKASQAYDYGAQAVDYAAKKTEQAVDYGLQGVSNVATFDTDITIPQVKVFDTEIFSERNFNVQNDLNLRLQEGVFTGKEQFTGAVKTSEHEYGLSAKADVALGYNNGFVSGAGGGLYAQKDQKVLVDTAGFVGNKRAMASLGVTSARDYVAQTKQELNKKTLIAMKKASDERKTRNYLASLTGAEPRGINLLPLNTFSGKLTLGVLQSGLGLLQTAFGVGEIAAGVGVGTAGTATGIGAVPGIAAGVGLGLLGGNNVVGGGTQAATGFVNIWNAFAGKGVVDYTFNPAHEAINKLVPQGTGQTAAHVGYELVDIFGGGFGIWKAGKIAGAAEVTAKLNPYELETTHGLTLSRNEFAKLKADIKANGIQEPIKFVEYNGKKYIVNGHHRLRAAKELGIQNVPVQEVKLPYAGYKTVEDLIYSQY